MKLARASSLGGILLLCVLSFAAHHTIAANQPKQEPICRIAAISNLYLTTKTAKELGPRRSFLARNAPDGIKRALRALETAKPDALIVLGSLTWTGSRADFQHARSFLDKVKVPWYVTGGEKDKTGDALPTFLKHFGEKYIVGETLNFKGTHLQFAFGPARPNGKEQLKLVGEINRGLSQAKNAKAVLLFGGLDYRTPSENSSPLERNYWAAIREHKVAARFIGGHSHYVGYEDSLPTWCVPSSGWTSSPRYSLALITVYHKRIELSLLREPLQPPQVLVIPNPVAAERMAKRDDDPYKLPTYSEDLAKKPELTFVQLSDSQFDDGANPRYSARYKYAEPMSELAVLQVNRLKPAHVFMTGDLTNNNSFAEWKTFGRIYGKLKPTLYPLPGNHDTLVDRTKLDAKTLKDLYASRLKSWTLADKLVGKKTNDRTTLYQHFTKRKPYYTVEKNGCVFICLNTGVASVDRKQMDWLRLELERTKSAKHVFVLGHYPVLKRFGNNVQGPEAAEIMHLLRKYKVAAYLSGHRHRYDYHVQDYTAHVLCDCLCWGEYCSYQVYHVFPDRIVACWKPIFRADGNRPLYERVVFPEPRHKANEQEK